MQKIVEIKNISYFLPVVYYVLLFYSILNTLRPSQNGRHFPDNIFKCILLNENVWIMIMISLKFVPQVLINNIPALVQIMAWSLPGDKPSSEPKTVNILIHICVTQPQWVNITWGLWCQKQVSQAWISNIIPCSVLILASDCLTTLKYRGVSHIWRHQREIWRQMNVIDDVTMEIPTAVRFP